MNKTCCIGIDLGGTKTHFALVADNGDMLHDFRTATDKSGGKVLLEDMLKGAEILIEYASANQIEIKGIGIGSPGRVDAQSGIVVDCTPNIIDWEGTNIKSYFEKELNFPAFADNDANAAAYGEYVIRRTAGLKENTMILLTLGTGLGSGIIYNNSLFRGKGLGSEIGHMILQMGGRPCNCGQRGCFEMYVSGTALEMQARIRKNRYPDSQINSLDDKEITTYKIFEYAKSGDLFSLILIDEMAEALAESLISLINIFDPDVILLSGGISMQKDFYLTKVITLVEKNINYKYFDSNIIQIAKNDEKAGVVGAGLLAFYGLKKGDL